MSDNERLELSGHHLAMAANFFIGGPILYDPLQREGAMKMLEELLVTADPATPVVPLTTPDKWCELCVNNTRGERYSRKAVQEFLRSQDPLDDFKIRSLSPCDPLDDDTVSFNKKCTETLEHCIGKEKGQFTAGDIRKFALEVCT